MSPEKRSTQLTVTLPEKVIEIIRARVGAGEYQSESAAIEAVIVESLLPSLTDEDICDEQLRDEALPVMEAMNANPERGLTVEQVRDNLSRRHQTFRKAG